MGGLCTLNTARHHRKHLWLQEAGTWLPKCLWQLPLGNPGAPSPIQISPEHPSRPGWDLHLLREPLKERKDSPLPPYLGPTFPGLALLEKSRNLLPGIWSQDANPHSGLPQPRPILLPTLPGWAPTSCLGWGRSGQPAPESGTPALAPFLVFQVASEPLLVSPLPWAPPACPCTQ